MSLGTQNWSPFHFHGNRGNRVFISFEVCLPTLLEIFIFCNHTQSKASSTKVGSFICSTLVRCMSAALQSSSAIRNCKNAIFTAFVKPDDFDQNASSFAYTNSTRCIEKLYLKNYNKYFTLLDCGQYTLPNLSA